MIYTKKRLLFSAILIAVLFALLSFASAETLEGDHAYISDLSVSSIQTGQEPFDKDDKPGNDSSDANAVIRTFDTVTYKLDMVISSHSSSNSDDGKQYDKARIHFAFKIPFTSDQAEFVTDSMAWMESGFRVEETSDGQVLYCSLFKEETPPKYAAPGTQSAFVCVKIKNLKNGQTVTPEFYAWMEDNRVLDANGKLDFSQTACPEHNVKELYKVTAQPVTVSAKLKLNVELTTFTGSYSAIYNFNSGNGATAKYPAMNRDIGTHTGSGVSIALGVAIVNDSISKKMYGVELPDGSPITFDIQLDTVYKLDNSSTTYPVKGVKNGISYDFTPIIYSYGGHTYAYTNDDGRSVPQRMSVPDNIRKNSSYTRYACCDGGLLKVEQDGNILHLTISDYKIDGTFPRRNGPLAITDSYTENIGYIATSEFHFFMPAYNQNGGTDGNEADYIAKMLGAGSFVFNVSAGNLRAQSQSASLPAPDTSASVPDNKNQVIQNDDKRTANVYLTNPGSYDTVCSFTNLNGTNQYYPLTPGCFYDSRDWSFANTEIALLSGVWAVYSKGEDLNRMIAFDDFLKIDTDAFTFVDRLKGSTSSEILGHLSSFTTPPKSPDGIVDYRQTSMPVGKGQQIKILYAVKKDGSGWTGDDEMRNTTQESSNLLWFDRLPDAEAAGKVVGLLFQYRGLTDPDSIYPRYQVLAHVNPDVEPDDTYMITHELRIWSIRSLIKLGLTPPEDLTTANNIKWFNNNTIPLRSATNTGYQSQLNTYLSACCAHFNQRYDRLIYKANGTTTGGTTSYKYGDSLYIAPYSSRVGINVINSSGGSENPVFDMGAEQNVADFAVTPIVSLPNIAFNDPTKVICDTITVTQMLPSALTYIPSSSTYGGKYVPAALHGRQGTVVKDDDDFLVNFIDNGTVQFNYKMGDTVFPIKATLNVKRSAAGETTLEYVFEGVPLASTVTAANALSKLIRFSTEIEPNTVTNWTIAETVSIHGKNEKSKIGKEYGNVATTSILVYQNTAEGIGVTADNLYNEQDAELGWTISYSNSSNLMRSDALLFVRMPEDRHNGTYALTEWTLDLAALDADGSGLELWYTTADMSEKNASDYTRAQLAAANSGFAKLTLTAKNGKLTASIPDEAKNATAWILTGPIGGRKTFSIHHTIKPTDNMPSDAYRTTAYFRADNSAPHSYATVYVVGRKVSGLVWYDKNYNGIREAGESVVPGVTVELYKGGTKLVKDVTGADIPVTVTDLNGAYSFSKISEGNYTVRFSGDAISAYTGITHHRVSGADASVNSDARLSGANIETNPAVAASAATQIARSYLQTHENLDLGLVKLGALSVSKTVTGDVPASGANQAFPFTLKLTLDGTAYTQPIQKGNASVTPAADGTVAFALKHGETADFSAIPVGVSYTVSEESVLHYTPSFTNETGSITETKAAVTCVNSYLPEETAYAPQVTKALNGHTPPTNAVFTFTLAYDGDQAENLTLPANMQTTVEGVGTTQFGAVTFRKAGSYSFSITEEANTTHGYTNDEKGKWMLTVNVTDENGKLTAVPQYSRAQEISASSATFTNTYIPDPVTHQISVNKRIEGFPAQEETYTFELTGENGAQTYVILPRSTKATVTGAGTATFDPITFQAAGTYAFAVREIAGETDNCTYDSSVLSVSITVIDTDGKLSVGTVSFKKNNAACEPEFVNAYKTGHLSITKTVEENTSHHSKAWHFTVTFTKASEEEYTLPLRYDGSVSGTVVSGGTLSLSHGQTVTIRNIPEGVTYAITENEANADRYITTSIGEKGLIQSNQTAVAAFTNTFTPYPAEYPITVKKRIEGSPALEETYIFELKSETAESESFTMPQSSEASVTGAGNAVFDPITFYKVGEYAFTVREIAGDTENCTYDDSELTVTLTVANLGGQLTVTKAVYEKDGEESEPEFVNAYQAGSLRIEKTVDGNDGELDRTWHFRVVLMDHSGKEYKTPLPYDGAYTGTVVSGDTVTLKHGEAIVIHSIPEGITYTVTETDANADGYTTTPEGAAGIIANGKTAKAHFTNTRIKADIPQTGDKAPLALLFLMLLMSLVIPPLLCKKTQKH